MGACHSCLTQQRNKFYAVENRAPKDSCVFCGIAHTANQPGSRVLYQTEQLVVFEDHKPAAARHLLVIPRTHIANVPSLKPGDLVLVRAMHAAGREVLSQLASENSEQTGTKTEKLQTEPSGAEEQGQFKFGYHLPPFNSVHHLHLHCFQLPHTPSWKGLKYGGSGCWWVGAEDVEGRLERQLQRLERLDGRLGKRLDGQAAHPEQGQSQHREGVAVNGAPAAPVIVRRDGTGAGVGNVGGAGSACLSEPLLRPVQGVRNGDGDGSGKGSH